MISKQIYFCEYCDANFESIDDCRDHEAQHFNLAPIDYAIWWNKFHVAQESSKTYGFFRDDFSKALMGSAIKRLNDFESQHHLPGDLAYPTHFSIKGEFHYA